MSTIAFIGAGNIARAIMTGVLAAGHGHTLIAADPDPNQLKSLPLGVSGVANNQQAVEEAETIVLCVKPDKMQQICTGLPNTAGKLFISVAAGITTTSLALWLGAEAVVVRCMPNTPALVQQGITGLYADASVSASTRSTASNILGAVGEVCWLDREAELDIVTAISGSGPAYFFLLMEQLELAGVALGLKPDIAAKLVIQTALGAATMARDTGTSLSDLRVNVTSKGGTTAAALDVFETARFPDTVSRAVDAAARRASELSGG